MLRTIKFYPSRTKSSVIGSRDYRHVSLIRARSDCGVNNVPSVTTQSHRKLTLPVPLS